VSKLTGFIIIIIIIIIYLLKSTEQEDAHVINTRTKRHKTRSCILNNLQLP